MLPKCRQLTTRLNGGSSAIFYKELSLPNFRPESTTALHTQRKSDTISSHETAFTDNTAYSIQVYIDDVKIGLKTENDGRSKFYRRL